MELVRIDSSINIFGIINYNMDRPFNDLTDDTQIKWLYVDQVV